MRVIAKRTLVEFWTIHPETEQPLKAWVQATRSAEWKTSADVKSTYAKASIVDNERVVFNVCDGNYRLVVAVDYGHQIVFIKFLGTHKEYDKIDAATVSLY